MNLGIAIGVSAYIKEIKLPACKSDAALINKLLLSTGKYEEVLLINIETGSPQVRENLRSFFSKYRDKGIDEVFFYFSGHGCYHTALDDVLLCCSDFDVKKPGSTSLTNSEIDDLLRSVSPKLAVKVIDACNSGAQYIKDIDTSEKFKKKLNDTKLKAFYFMASSKLDQSSYATESHSHFTIKFVEGALNLNTGDVLFRDIQAYIADSFVDKIEQTPFFVIQGTGLELFSSVCEKMREMRKELNSKNNSQDLPVEEPGKDGELKRQLTKIIAERDASYVKEVETVSALEGAKAGLIKEQFHDALVREFYNLYINFDGKLESLPAVASIADWASEGNRSKKYFLRVNEESREVPVDSLMFHLPGQWSDPFASKTIWKSFPVSVSATKSLPFEVINVCAKPINHPALPPFTLYIGILHSKVEVLVFSTVCALVESGWEEYSVDQSVVKWQKHTGSWRTIINNPNILWRELFVNLEECIRKYLEGLSPKKEENKISAEVSTSASPVIATSVTKA